MNILKFFRRTQEQRLEAHRKWMRKNKIVILAKPKPDDRCSIELNRRILAKQ